MEKINLLIVDDIADNIYSLRYLLEEKFDDINILEADNVKDALIIIMKNEVDLILSDIQMPEIDGFQFVEYLQGIEDTRHIPIILITGIYNNEIYQKKAYNSSSTVVDFITKPIDTEILCSKLNVFIKLFKERKKDKKEIAEKDKLLRSRDKIKTMLSNLDGLHDEIKEQILQTSEIKGLLLDEAELIDLDKLN
ncbi:response regulator [Halarcobacter ebronensis]|uniref:Response regulatory domain-containing protein n=1 Tax=Halarcobacter ebronensis TaxID=1462615 RepID=A0A4Q1AF80_9BACT|nr:response regulator [Halarcobacter ebronensis]QKF81889.1 two-component system response regulator [Halarcobacter ebronensis]RXK02155.1 hypothetical protein CRV07_14170 [Halarcobacter ebronensis]